MARIGRTLLTESPYSLGGDRIGTRLLQSLRPILPRKEHVPYGGSKKEVLRLL